MNLQKLRDVIAAEPELGVGNFVVNGKCCALGAVIKSVGYEPEKYTDSSAFDDDEWETMLEAVRVAYAMSQAYQDSPLALLPLVNDGQNYGHLTIRRDGAYSSVHLNNPLPSNQRDGTPKERVLRYLDLLIAAK